MKKLIIAIGVLVGILGMLIAFSAKSQHQPTVKPMKLNAGIITPKLRESKAFYTNLLNFGVTFENDFYLLLHTPDHTAEVGFLLPDHPSQRPVFQSAFQGNGIYFTIEVQHVDEDYKRIKLMGIPIAIELRVEPWGDRHFAILDPNGIGVDIVTYTSSESKP